jgi:hypothetical protein
VADPGGRADHLGEDLANQQPVTPVGRTGHANCRDDRSGVLSHRSGYRVEALLEFLNRTGVPIPSGFFDVGTTPIERRDGVSREAGQPRAQHLPALYRSHVREQDLAAAGGAKPGELTDPVVRADRGRPARLVEIDDEMRTPHDDVDGLAETQGEMFTDRPVLPGDLQTTGNRTDPTQHAETQAVLVAVLSLLNSLRSCRVASNPEPSDLETSGCAAISLTPAPPRAGAPAKSCSGPTLHQL